MRKLTLFLILFVQGCSPTADSVSEKCVSEFNHWFVAQAKGPPGTPQMNLSLSSDGSVMLDKPYKTISQAELYSLLSSAREMNPTPTINLITNGADCKTIRRISSIITNRIDCRQSICLLNNVQPKSILRRGS